MTKVTVHSQPAASVKTPVAANPDSAVVADAKGRQIGVARIKALDMYRLTKLLGESSGNPATLNLAMAAASVRSIDGEAIGFPVTEREVEFTLQRLDFHGLAAASEALKQIDTDTVQEITAAKN